MSDFNPDVISEHAWNAAGDPVPVDDPTATSIEVWWRDAEGGEQRTYLTREPDNQPR